MQPRLSTSKSWTGLPPEFSQKASQVFAQNFRDESEAGEFLVQGRIYADEILLQIGYLQKGRLKQTNFEVSVDHSPNEKAMDKLFFAIDVLGAVFESHFEHLREDDGEEIEYPLRWEEHEFDGHPVFLRYSTANTALEAEADRLLGLGGSALYNESDVQAETSQDALVRAEVDPELAEQVSQAIRAGRFRPIEH